MGGSLRDRALRLLARREHSRAELRSKLLAAADPDDDVDALLDEFERRGWLSDKRFAEQRVTARRGRFGTLKIAHELKAKGVSGEVAETALAEARASETSACREVWRKRFGRAPATREERAKQARFLQSRGFGAEAIRAVLNGADDAPMD
ncbi:MAG: recombination regulator RecX [Pseudomonadota bacterium]